MTTDTANKVVQTISAVLDELGRRFGATGAHLWEQLVRYRVGSAIAVTGVWFAVLVAGIVVIRINRSKCTWGENVTLNDLLMIAGCIAVVVGGIGFGINLADLVPTLMAPEAAVMHDLF